MIAAEVLPVLMLFETLALAIFVLAGCVAIIGHQASKPQSQRR